MRTTHPRPVSREDRDPLCDECACAPGEHRIAAVIAYCDTKHEHEGRLLTDGSVAYAYGPHTDVTGVYLAHALTATWTPVGGMILAASCGQPLPGTDEPCQGDLCWTIERTDWNGPAVTAADRALLVRHNAGIEGLPC